MLPMGIIIVTGYNPANSEASINQNKFIEVMDVNYTGPILFINEIKKILKTGFIIGISSVAGEREGDKRIIYMVQPNLHSALI